jgi:molybdenum cofactor cytidylyltransferase
MSDLAAIVLAAGEARRFGARKQMAELQGRPLLEHALATAAELVDRVYVVLGSGAGEIEAGIELGAAIPVRCADWRSGPGASLRAGLSALGSEFDATLVLLGDEPFLPADVAERLLAARCPDNPALRASYCGRPGHPVLIERRLIARLLAAPPDRKPAATLREAGALEIECGDLGEPRDVDTPADLRALADGQ